MRWYNLCHRTYVRYLCRPVPNWNTDSWQWVRSLTFIFDYLSILGAWSTALQDGTSRNGTVLVLGRPPGQAIGQGRPRTANFLLFLDDRGRGRRGPGRERTRTSIFEKLWDVRGRGRRRTAEAWFEVELLKAMGTEVDLTDIHCSIPIKCVVFRLESQTIEISE